MSYIALDLRMTLSCSGGLRVVVADVLVVAQLDRPVDRELGLVDEVRDVLPVLRIALDSACCCRMDEK